MRQFIIWIFLFFAPVVYATTMVDDAGQTIVLNKPAQRIISLAPDITEILFAIGAGDRVVGVISGSDYPAAARALPVMGAYTGIDLERVMALHPDLIVAWQGTFPRELAALKNKGIPVYLTKPKLLEDIPRTMQQLGTLAGTTKQASAQAQRFLKRLAVITQRYRNRQPVTVFYQIGDYSLITINQDSWINQAITVCGGRNVFAELKSIAPEIDWEAVVTANPQVIISDATSERWRDHWKRWQTITAVRKGWLFNLSPDLIERASPRLLDGVEQMCDLLQRVSA